MSKSVLIRYVIPEDGDDFQHPNVFRIMGVSLEDLTLSIIKRAFPVPGTYYFRFMTTVSDKPCFLDISDENSPLPNIDGSIMAKVTRLEKDRSIQTQSRPVIEEVVKNVVEFQQPVVIEPEISSPKKVEQEEKRGDLLGDYSSSATSSSMPVDMFASFQTPVSAAKPDSKPTNHFQSSKKSAFVGLNW